MDNKNSIIDYLQRKPNASSKEIFEGAGSGASYATIKRQIAALLRNNYIVRQGNAKNTRYSLSANYHLLCPVDLTEYYSREIDGREILPGYNFDLIPKVLSKTSLFTDPEIEKLNAAQARFTGNIAQLSAGEYERDMERLAIDLSWKSSQIEGNTYSLLETERLLREKKTADGKTKDEAIMLLNHKDAIDFIVSEPGYFADLSIAKIENIHAILVKELGVDTNIRRRRVGITGTNYRPLDNEFQIREALQATCSLINAKENVFEKSLLALVLLSYIQAFNDGNKRTARIVANAVFIANRHCPLSFRTVDSVDYKKAMLLFYEQNNISAFKQIFMEQFEFAVQSYF